MRTPVVVPSDRKVVLQLHQAVNEDVISSGISVVVDTLSTSLGLMPYLVPDKSAAPIPRPRSEFGGTEGEE